MNKFKRGLLRFIVAICYFTIILSPFAMTIDVLMEIEERLDKDQ